MKARGDSRVWEVGMSVGRSAITSQPKRCIIPWGLSLPRLQSRPRRLLFHSIPERHKYGGLCAYGKWKNSHPGISDYSFTSFGGKEIKNYLHGTHKGQSPRYSSDTLVRPSAPRDTMTGRRNLVALWIFHVGSFKRT